MSLARKAVHGAMWTVGASMSARLVGLVGTVVITHFLAPDVIAEVNAASIMVMSGSLISNLGLGNYYIVKGGDPEVGFHMTAYSLLLAFLGLGVVWLLDDPLSAWFGVPGMVQYVPGLVAAWVLRRVGALPQKVLAREMRFRRLSLSRAAGEITYVVSSVALAATGWGGQAVVIGNILQGGVDMLITATGVSWRTWLLPYRLRWERTKDMLRFGLPLGANAFLAYCSGNWDRLVYVRYFGPSMMGLYQYGYRLAEIPAAQLGEQISDVLLPSMSQLDHEGRNRALVRSTGLLSLVIFPLCVGLAAVAQPLINVILDDEWHGVAPFVTILSAVSLFQPLGSTLGAYLIARSRTFMLLMMEVLRLVTLIGGMMLFARLGSLWICAGVGMAFAVHTLVTATVCVRVFGVSGTGLCWAFLRPLLACLPMVAAVLGARYGLRAAGVHRDLISLILEITAGALVYVPSAFVLARPIARDFLDLLRKALRRG
jgi:PST family polysaccharide transporter